MNLPNLENYILVLPMLGCLIVGYVIKKTPLFSSVANDYIPLIVAVVGALLGVLANGVSLESVIYGAISGLASTGLHQAFTRFLYEKEENERNGQSRKGFGDD